MSYAVFGPDALDPIGWSQAVWRIEGRRVDVSTCAEELIHDVLLEFLPRDGLIADTGCGSGRWPIYLHRRGYRMIGIDISLEACRIARENEPRLPVLCTDARRAPLRSGALDAVLSSGVVEHDQAGPREALRELRRVLKPGGVLVLAVPYDNAFRRWIANRLLDAVTRRRRRNGWKLAFTEYRFDMPELRELLRDSGFTEIAVRPNDIRPPRNMGLWVDYHNLRFNPLQPTRLDDLFMLPRSWAWLAHYVARRFPWLVCGEVVFVARAT